jgi:DNA-binding transcriptional ArsR family regulator
MAVNSPVRREILRVLMNDEASVQILRRRTGLDEETLEWHLSILEHGRCVTKEDKDGVVVYRITQEGRVVDYMKP